VIPQPARLLVHSTRWIGKAEAPRETIPVPNTIGIEIPNHRQSVGKVQP
jgi:hypothetical protein